MPKYYDITNWNQLVWLSTGGTRDKKYVQSSDGRYFYFKKSYKTQGRSYFYEFWSEIIASEIGTLLGFKMLKYDLARDGDEMGCISESMIMSDSEALIEGVRYLQAKENQFKPNIRATHKLYSFKLIEEALLAFRLSTYISDIIEIIVFDAVISNGDRHQENWAFIMLPSFFQSGIDEMEVAVKEGRMEKFPRFLKVLFGRFFDIEKKIMHNDAKAAQLYLTKIKDIAPIYDSGSSLGREILDEDVSSMLADESRLISYIKKGKSEIRWQEDKIDHFSLVKMLLSSKHSKLTEQILDRVFRNYDEKAIESIIMNVDSLVPRECNKHMLPSDRKKLIFKIITLRIALLEKIYNERV